MRRWLVSGLVVIVFGAGLWWWLRGDELVVSGAEAATGGSASQGPLGSTAAPPKWTQPIEKKGTRTLAGRVTQAGQPVPGATVTALAAHGDDVLSDLPCKCDNHCGQRLLACGCAEASGQLVELVAARVGEVQPVGRAISGADGRFELDGLPEGVLALWADAAGGVAFQPGVSGTDAKVALELQAGKRLEGDVKGDDEKPIAGAVVTAIFAEHSRFFDVVADAKGHFTLGPLLDGKYAVVAVREGLLPDHHQVTELDGQVVKLTLSEPRTLSGTVARDGKPAAGATVKLDGMHRKRTATSDAKGAFRFERLRPGEYQLVATAAGGRASASVRVDRRKDRADVALMLGPGADVTGTVTDPGGAPLADVRVSYTAAKIRTIAQSDAHGTFRFEGVPLGPARLAFTKDRFVPSVLPLTVAAGAAPVRHALEPAATIFGKVVDSSGRLVPTFEIRAESPERATPPKSRSLGEDDDEFSTPEPSGWDTGERAYDSSTDGGFALDVRPGTWELSVSAKDSPSATQTVRAPATGVVIALRSGGRIEGVALDAEERPLGGLTVYAMRESPDGGTRRSEAAVAGDAEGKFTLKGLTAGTYWVASSGGYSNPKPRAVRPPQPVTVQVREGETTTITLRAPKGATVSGRVVDANDKPVEKAMVSAEFKAPSEERGDHLGVTTGADGAFELVGLPAGPVKLWAMEPTSRASAKATVTAPAADVRLRFTSRTELVGRVLGESDAPLTSFSVQGQHQEPEDGRFSVPATVGESIVTFEADGYAQLGVSVTVKGGTNDLGDVHLSRGRPLEGTVTDAVSGQPIPGALVDVGLKPADGKPKVDVALDERLGAAKTDATGHYRLAQVDGRSNEAYATHPDYPFATQPLGPSLGHLDFKLTPGSRVSLSVVDATSAPLSGAYPVATNGAGRFTQAERARPPETGWTLRGLEAGEWTVLVHARGRTFHPQMVSVTAGSRQSVTIREATDGVDVGIAAPERMQLILVSGPPPASVSTWSSVDVYGSGREVLELVDGKFTHVRPGPWTLFAMRVNADDSTEALLMPVVVAAQSLALTLPSAGWQPYSRPQ